MEFRTRLVLFALLCGLVFFGPKLLPPEILPPAKDVVSLVYVYEKDANPPTPAIKLALLRVNQETEISTGNTDDDNETHPRYGPAIRAAAGKVPCLVVGYSDESLEAVKIESANRILELAGLSVTPAQYRPPLAPTTLVTNKVPAQKFVRYNHERRVRWNSQVLRNEPSAMAYRSDGKQFRPPARENPNNTATFMVPGGLEGLKGITTRKEIYLPAKPERFVVRETRRNGNRYPSAWHTRYPVGTVTRETIYHNRQPFEQRTWTKTTTGWQPDLRALGPEPPGYAPPDDCQSCHEQAGKEAHTIPEINGRSWWGYGIAPGDDMVISYDPVQAK